MSTTVKTWLHSLAAAAIGGASTAASAALVAPDTFNLFSSAGIVKLLEMMFLGAIIPVLALLKQSPLPPDTPAPTGGPVAPGGGPTLRLLVLFCLLVGAAAASAQSGVTFVGTTEVTGLHFNGVWSPANHTTESLDLIDWGPTKGNSLSIEGHQLTAPGPSLNAYMGGAKFVPDISSLISKTNLAGDQLGVFVQAAAGVGTLPAKSSFAFLVGGGVNYRLTSNVSFSTIDFRVGRAGSEAYYEVSSGIQYIFNPQSAKAMAAKRFLLKRALLSRAAAQ